MIVRQLSSAVGGSISLYFVDAAAHEINGCELYIRNVLYSFALNRFLRALAVYVGNSVSVQRYRVN